MRSVSMRRVTAAALVAAAAVVPNTLAAQTRTPAATAESDKPSISGHVTLFTDYTFQVDPRGENADGQAIHNNAFTVSRSYLTLQGKLNRLLEFRVTADAAPETGSGSSLNGSYTFRIKYAFAQLDLDEWLPRGSWVRVGMSQTPFIDYYESVYRYRFEGTTFIERNGYTASSDAGVSFHTVLPQGYGDVHVGVYNGETYKKLETNDQKAFEIRFTAAPAAGSSTFKGLHVTAFYIGDHYATGAPRTRVDGWAYYANTHLTVSAEYLAAQDQPLASAPTIKSRGYSLWAIPRLGHGWEALLRVDRLRPDVSQAARKSEAIAGLAYWFPVHDGPSAAILVDWDQVTFRRYLPDRPDERRLVVHGLINF